MWGTTVIEISVCALQFGCPASGPTTTDKTFLVSNKTRDWHVLMELVLDGGEGHKLPILRPGSEIRERFDELIGETCPETLIVRTYLAERNTEGTLTIIASAETEVKPCRNRVQVLSPVFDIFVRDSDRGVGTLLFEQGTEDYIRFDFGGLNLPLPAIDQFPSGPESRPTSGFAIDSEGKGVPGVGVIMWTLYRRTFAPADKCTDTSPDRWQRATTGCGGISCCCCEQRVCDRGSECCDFQSTPNLLGEPIGTDVTDENGRFEISAPPGVYTVEVFGDDLLFRPREVQINAPLDNVIFLVQKDEAEDGELEDVEDEPLEDEPICNCAGGCQ